LLMSWPFSFTVGVPVTPARPETSATSRP
jgi:hypothetical protein